MEFDIDVSGTEIFSKNYTIVIADKNSLIKGFKFNEEIIQVLKARYGEGKYRYTKSKKHKSLFAVRVYCIIIYYLFKNIQEKLENKDLVLNICRDFSGKENDIKIMLTTFLKENLNLKSITFYFSTLPKGSNADKYAFIMRQDRKNLLKTYVRITVKEIEQFLKK
jgi:hypothetical protein